MQLLVCGKYKQTENTHHVVKVGEEAVEINEIHSFALCDNVHRTALYPRNATPARDYLWSVYVCVCQKSLFS